MTAARGAWALLVSAQGLALCCALGPLGCNRAGQADAAGPAPPSDGQIDLTSSGPQWPTLEPEPAGTVPLPELTDADVEQIATRVPRARVPAVTADNPSKGAPGARVTLQIFGDFQCPACVRAEPTLLRVEQRYQGKVRVVWRHFPLPSHERAKPAARAAVAAFRAGGNAAFWKLHDWLYSGQADLSGAGLRGGASRLGLDPDLIERAASDTSYDAVVDADVAAGDHADVQGTPAVFINDYYLIGVRDEAQYALVIERALREAR